jgi:hypothetical protein
VQYLILERKDVNGQTQNQAALTFNHTRRGLASLIGAPGPMGSLDFVSPDASLATSIVIRNPNELVGELLSIVEQHDPDVTTKIEEFQRDSGINVMNDIAQSLGSEATFALDGPLLPVPSWKLSVEVYSPDRLQYSIQKLVDYFDKQPGNTTKLHLTSAQSGSRTFYTITADNAQGGTSPFEVHYTFVDSYLIAAPSQNLLVTAIQNRTTGYTLARSQNFRNQLPNNGNPYFSGILYHNVGSLVGPLVDKLKSVNGISADQHQAIDALKANSGPGLIYAYGQDDRIVLSANGSLFGFSLDSLALPKVIEQLVRSQQKIKPQIQ